MAERKIAVPRQQAPSIGQRVLNHGQVPVAPLQTQVGGQHYKGLAIQPVEYAHANKLGFCEATAIKHLTRWREKNGLEDLRKAIHYIELLIELEERSADTFPEPPV